MVYLAAKCFYAIVTRAWPRLCINAEGLPTSVEEEQVTGLVSLVLHHHFPFSFCDDLSMVVTHYVTFSERCCCNNSCDKESITYRVR